MTSRERIQTIISGQAADRCGFWMGSPHPDTWPIYHGYFRTTNEEELRLKLGDDFRWLGAWKYSHPQGRPMWHIPAKKSHGDPGPFASCTDIGQLDEYEWPQAQYMDFTAVQSGLRRAGDFYRAGGMWCCFYHNVMDLFGMEAYLVNMYENPALVQAVTDRVCQFYYDANERYFDLAGRELDGFFFGNDFGTQLDTICGPEHFDRFVMPWFRRFTEQARRRGYQVILHSCGSIHRFIDRLIGAGVNCLHPLQARARNMDAATLARDFGGRISFLGGIDTQDLLVNGTPEQVKEDVGRVKRLLGPRLIVSPSHEALLPNVPPQNVEAMAQAVIE
jgi:uroporphyrinogen decarboxylase